VRMDLTFFGAVVDVLSVDTWHLLGVVKPVELLEHQ